MGQVCTVVLPTICMAQCCEKCCCCCMSKEVPWDPTQLTPTFFTNILRSKGILSTHRVASVETQIFGVGKGLLSVMYRATLTYENEAKSDDGEAPLTPGAPKSLVVKMTPTGLKPRLIGEFLSLFKAEVTFLQRDLSAKVGIDTPVCYFAAHAGYGRYLVVLEDLAPAASGDQAKGASLEEAEVAIKNIAKLHAKYRGRTRTSEDTRDWLLMVDDIQYYGKLVKDKLVKANKDLDKNMAKVEIPKEMLTPSLRKGYGAVTEYYANAYVPSIAVTSAEGVNRYTLCHGDYRMENIFFKAGPKGDTFKMIDFQLLKECPGEVDLYYFLAQSLTPEVRRKHEKHLIRLYLDETRKAAAEFKDESTAEIHKGYDMAEVLQNFYFGAVTTYIVSIIGLGDADTDSEGAKVYWRNTVIPRDTAMIEDWEIAEFLRKKRELCFDEDTQKLRRLTTKELRSLLPKAYVDLLEDDEKTAAVHDVRELKVGEKDEAGALAIDPSMMEIDLDSK